VARKVRVFLEQSAQHVILKSLHGLSLYNDKEDYETFLQMLEELSKTYRLSVHAYILLPEQFEFVATPLDAEGLSKFMQSLGRKYVGYFNKKYKRLGTLFEGRYKASLLEDEKYLLPVMIYIERLNSKEYVYSSVGKNLTNKTDGIITPHKLYKALGYRDEERTSAYKKMYEEGLSSETKTFIQTCLEKQLVTASPDFVSNIEKIVGVSLRSRKRGRPPKQNSEKRKKMYKNLVVLDKEKHKDLKISPLADLSFAKSTPYIPVVANEVSKVGAAFPIVFTADEEPALVALVSLGGDNLAINNEGKWITNYVPAYLRKYPFALASTEENSDNKVILIDEDAPVFSKSKGKQLFKKSGEKSEVLSHAIEFLSSFESAAQVTKNVANVIAESGILEDREISVGEGEEKKVLVNGFKVVNREKLNALSDDVLAEWVRKGIITLIDAHLKSLENMQTLFTLAQQRQ
jgi:putative transposase